MAVSKANVLSSLNWFKGLQDNFNEAKFVQKEDGKGLSTNDFTDEDREKLDSLKNYELPTASAFVKGGVRVGTGLAMSGDLLYVTGATGGGGGGSYDVFKGATATRSGASGLVPAPLVGDHKKVLRGDGTWGDDITGALSSITSLSTAINSLSTTINSLKLGQENVIEAVKVNNSALPVSSKAVNIDLSGYAKKTEVASGIRMKGSVHSFADLPANPVAGDLYNIQTAGGIDGEGVAIEAGDNVVYTDKGTWDVMAGFIDTSDFVRINTFNSALSSINSLSVAINGLSNYDLPTASTTTKGGVMIGAGLSMSGDVLNVTLTGGGGGGGTYTDFTGATSITGGASGLVPAPAAGDQGKFLRGDGNWAAFQMVIGGGSITIGSDTAATQGALWQDFFTDSVGNKTPVLKLRYGDYEYNFHYDTSKQLASTAPALVTDVGVQYNLSTLPSSEEGGIWYEVADNVPTLFMHKSVFNYGYNYDTITYKGTNANLYSYLPLESSFADALGNNWTVAATAKIEQAPWGGNALRNTGGMTLKVGKAYNMFTLDFWLYADLSRFPADTKTAYNILQIVANAVNAGSMTLPLVIKNKILTVSMGNKTDTFDLPSGERTHIALVHTKNGRCGMFINGKRVATVLGQYGQESTDTIKIFSTATNDYPAYIDHFRIFKNQILWDSDFEVPKPEDYMK